jgi:predicted RNA-binding protein with PUA-like domain
MTPPAKTTAPTKAKKEISSSGDSSATGHSPYWLVKTEPGEFSFQDLMRDGKTVWDGIRNHQAKKNLSLMKVGDKVLVYHSVTDKEVVGLAEVTKTAYPDPKENPDKTWLVVELKPVAAFPKTVTLQDIKQTEALSQVALVKQVRLSVMPLTLEAFQCLLKMGNAEGIV